MDFYQRFVPGLAISSHMIGDEKSGEAIVIDATRDVDCYLDHAKKNGLHIRHIIETHVHADFVCGSRELKDRLGDEATLWCSSYGGEDWSQGFADKHVQEGDAIEFGDLQFEFLHTPGHTPEHITITMKDTSRSKEVPWLAFTGDFLFVGDVGRPDLLGEEEKKELAHELYNSVFQKLPSLEDTVEIFPSHGAGSLCGKAIGSRRSSTVGFERRFSESLQEKPEDKWIKNLLDSMPLAPDYFNRMKTVNNEGPAVLGPELPGQKRISADEARCRFDDGCLMLDVRPKEAFAAAHVPGSINIPLGDNLPSWAGWVLPYDKPLLVVLDDPASMPQVAKHLIRVGFDDIQGYLEGGFGAWETGGRPLAMLQTLSVADLKKRHAEVESDALTILDVRTETEWNDGHIDGAIHVHGGVLQKNFEDVPRDRPVAVVCGSGYRASIAASFLKREGYTDVMNVMGGMSAWKAADLPTVK